MNRALVGLFLLIGSTFSIQAQQSPPAPSTDTSAAALYKASEAGDLNQVKALLDQGAPIDGISGQYGFTALIAGADGHFEILKFLVDKKANLDLPDVQGSTPLLHACWQDHTDNALALINAGAHVNFASNAGRTPLMYASMHGNDQIVAALIAHKVKIDDNCNQGPAVTWAASADKLSTLKLLVAAGAKLTLMPVGGNANAYSIMARAAASNDIDMINFLLDQKIDVNIPSADGGTALMAAAEYKYPRVIDQLLDHGASVDLQDNEGNSALIWARDGATIDSLLKHHANPELKNKKGMTALMVAASSLNDEAVHALVDAGADINVADAHGETALTNAGDLGGASIVDYLKSKGAQRTDVHVIVKGDPDPAMTPAHAWALAVGAYYIQVNEFNPRVLGGGKKITSGTKAMLQRDWNVRDHASLIKQLDDMRDNGHHAAYQAEGTKLDAVTDDQFNQLLAAHPDKTTAITAMRTSYRKWKERTGLAWDIVRSANLINSGYAVGYLTEQEAWDRLMANAQLAQKSFSSWQELNDNFLDGREIWANTRSPRFEAFAKLLLNPNDPNSPWNQNPWKTDLSAAAAPASK